MASIGGFERRPLVAIAVSGGSDSMALALLARDWVSARDGELRALHVDHRLRPDSAMEALRVSGWLHSLGIAHETLVWDAPKPQSGIQEAARSARYHLLSEWCRAHGCLHLLTAHQSDDQVETHLIRRRAGSGPLGLAGMSAVRVLDGCRLVRPLLTFPRARLATLLAAAGQDFLTDPSNLNPVFERARLRLASTAPERNITQTVRLHGERRVEHEQMLDQLLAAAVAIHPAGIASIDQAALSAAAPDMADALLARVTACIGVGSYQPRRERVSRLRLALGAASPRGRTLAGCRLVPWRGSILVHRELAAASSPKLLHASDRVIWDRRFLVELPAAARCSVTVGYLDRHPPPTASGSSVDLPRLLWPAVPAIWDDNGLAAVPHLGFTRPDCDPLPRLEFRPENPLSRAAFTVV